MADTAPMPSPMLLLFIALIVAANASTTWAIHAARKNGWTKPQIRWYVAAFAAADLIGMVGVLATITGAPLLDGASAVTAWASDHPLTAALTVGLPAVVVATSATTVHGIVHTSSLAGQDNSGTLAGQ